MEIYVPDKFSRCRMGNTCIVNVRCYKYIGSYVDDVIPLKLFCTTSVPYKSGFLFSAFYCFHLFYFISFLFEYSILSYKLWQRTLILLHCDPFLMKMCKVLMLVMQSYPSCVNQYNHLSSILMTCASFIRSLAGLKTIEIKTLKSYGKIKDTCYTYDASTLTSLWELKSSDVQEIMKAKCASINIPHAGLRKSVLQ